MEWRQKGRRNPQFSEAISLTYRVTSYIHPYTTSTYVSCPCCLGCLACAGSVAMLFALLDDSTDAHHRKQSWPPTTHAPLAALPKHASSSTVPARGGTCCLSLLRSSDWSKLRTFRAARSHFSCHHTKYADVRCEDTLSLPHVAPGTLALMGICRLYLRTKIP